MPKTNRFVISNLCNLRNLRTTLSVASFCGKNIVMPIRGEIRLAIGIDSNCEERDYLRAFGVSGDPAKRKTLETRTL